MEQKRENFNFPNVEDYLQVLVIKLNIFFQYEFPKPEWEKVSKDAKDLIRGMLETEPQKRLTIDDIIKNKWIAVSSQTTSGFIS